MVYHNYIAEPGEYPTVMQSMGYAKKEEYNKRFKKNAKQKAELWALKKAYIMSLKKDNPNDWRKVLRHMYRPFRAFNKTIVSGTKIIVAWN